MKEILKLSLKLFLVFMLVTSLQAVSPRQWELRSREDFLKGKFSGTSLSSDGVLSIGFRIEKIELPVEEFYLSIANGPDGSLYVGTGHGGRVYRIGRDRKAELYFQAAEMDVTCLAVDPKGILYVGTSPNGKIYKVTSKNKGEVFFDPQEKYLWDLLLTDKGNLLAAVGESAGVYEIAPSGSGKMLFKARDNHILRLVLSRTGELLAGSGGRGQLYKVSLSGRVSVVFDSGYEEIRNIVQTREGYIYVSASGQPSRMVATVSTASETEPVRIDTEVSLMVSTSGAARVASETAPARAEKKPVGAVSGAIFEISSEGLSRKIWSSAEEMVYSLIPDSDRLQLLLGTGNQGRIYALDNRGQFELLAQESSEQIFELYRMDNQILVLGNNPCFLGILQPGQNFSGEYLSPVLDARILSNWGRISWEAEFTLGSTVQVQSRSGNTAEPDETWSDWSPPYARPDEKILSPSGRYLQLKVSLKGQGVKAMPKVQRVLVFYQQNNVAPEITRLEILPVNQVFIKPPEQDDTILGLDQASLESARKKDESGFYLTPKKMERQGFRTLRWEASDENEDNLSASIYIRKEGETDWRLMQENLTDKVFSFDTRNFPDGIYWLKVEVTDLPSNPPGTEKKAEKISPPVVIDNSLPVIKNFQAARTGERLEVSFTAEDAYSYIAEVRYLIKPDDWKLVFPVDGICDSRSESFKFNLKLPQASDNLLIIRVKDSFGNVGVYHHRF
jgi:hypothetical protein